MGSLVSIENRGGGGGYRRRRRCRGGEEGGRGKVVRGEGWPAKYSGGDIWKGDI